MNDFISIKNFDPRCYEEIPMYDVFGKRYFKSTIALIIVASEIANYKIEKRHKKLSFNDIFKLIGLEPIEKGESIIFDTPIRIDVKLRDFYVHDVFGKLMGYDIEISKDEYKNI